MRKRPCVQIRVDSWEDAVVLGKGLAGHVFRGQSDAKWSLSTTIERAARRYGFPDGALRNREIVLLNNFQRRAHQYVDDPPSFDDRLEWLALMQHHGAPTRLLDFSHSFYVAAFFAMESAEQDAAIWALSTEFTMGHTSNLLSETKTMLDLEEESRAVLQAHLSGHQTSTCVMLVEPHRMNARLAVQQGCFVAPGDLSKSFM
jgi:FRG domain